MFVYSLSIHVLKVVFERDFYDESMDGMNIYSCEEKVMCPLLTADALTDLPEDVLQGLIGREETLYNALQSEIQETEAIWNDFSSFITFEFRSIAHLMVERCQFS